ncbi:PREDICTED: U7 snRNA-associated Sm-like protein LSm10 [Nicrophorus vespilloides]|uniref:U7 snRNA-associated Sm-like protein LSm10 n=1 Tax=Nicrophorus vespilloides TaxID=110193 RepID=A0ABM1M0U0_NICVS|nr:PREDICTED: U7 snRNA-associated Sm-like protein LSm10 [Nicrophorus vespilloides]
MSNQIKDVKSIYLLHNSMACLLNALVGKYTVIDLRNESSVHGKVVEVDGYMNTELEDCTFQNARGELLPFETFFVRSRNIRYVHVPSDCTALDLLQEQLKPKLKKVRSEKKKLTFKMSRARKYQNQILTELAQKS